MSTKMSNIVIKGKEKSSQNPFVKMVEDKKRIVNAIKEGKDLSKLKGINFVCPI